MINKGTITRLMDKTLGDLEAAFSNLYTRQDLYGLLEEMSDMDVDERPSALRRLYRMLDAAGIAYEKKQPQKYYEGLIRNSTLPEPEDVEQKMLSLLYDRFEDFPAPDTFMRRMIDKFSVPADAEAWADDSLRLRILKQFIKYGDGLAEVGYKGEGTARKYAKDRKAQAAGSAKNRLTDDEVLLYLDDGVFACLDDADKSQLKPEGTFGLLKLADDLAGGKFRTQGATRRGLYAFAVVFGMTYYIPELSAASIRRYDTDIDKNLFRDYYANNLMRFVRASYREQAGSFERDPSGQGINYRNFAEMIYLYYIARELPPQEKLKKVGAMTERVKKACEHKGAPSCAQPAMTAEEILSLPEQEFEKHLCTYYNCDIYSAGNYPLGVFQLEAGQDNAFDEYQQIIQALEVLEQPLEECCYGLWFTDTQMFGDMPDDELCELFGGQDPKKARTFAELLLSVDSFLGGGAAQNPLLLIDKPENMTRTAVFTAWYYYYNCKNENDDRPTHKNFAEVYEDFRTGLDPMLENCGYQKITSKSIFDILVVFSAYAYQFE